MHIERRQLAQCLEYAGWARGTNLDELAGLYHGGPEAFFADWQEFTDTNAQAHNGIENDSSNFNLGAYLSF